MARNYGMSVRASGILDRFMETQNETLTTDQILGRCSHGTDFYWGHRERQPRKIAQYFRANPIYEYHYLLKGSHLLPTLD